MLINAHANVSDDPLVADVASHMWCRHDEYPMGDYGIILDASGITRALGILMSIMLEMFAFKVSIVFCRTVGLVGTSRRHVAHGTTQLIWGSSA